MRTTRYHAVCLECTFRTVGINRQPAFTRGRIHHVRQEHEVEFRISGAGEEDYFDPEVVSGWA